MRQSVPKQLDDGRVTWGEYASLPTHGFNGAFVVMGPTGKELRIISSTALAGSDGWEHVSVSTKTRTPNWAEMCFVKNLFFDDEEVALQFHPPKSTHVNNHPHCLHLWKDVLNPTPRMPSAILVGIKSAGELRGREHAAAVRLAYDQGLIKE